MWFGRLNRISDSALKGFFFLVSNQNDILATTTQNSSRGFFFLLHLRYISFIYHPGLDYYYFVTYPSISQLRQPFYKSINPNQLHESNALSPLPASLLFTYFFSLAVAFFFHKRKDLDKLTVSSPTFTNYHSVLRSTQL